jgi:hypothetical protein
MALSQNIEVIEIADTAERRFDQTSAQGRQRKPNFREL